MMPLLARHGVALKILSGLVLLALFAVMSGIVAVFSFRDVNRAFTLVTSEQITTMTDAAELRQHSEEISSLAAALFARDLNEGTLLGFSTQMFNQQAELQRLVKALSDRLAKPEDLSVISDAAAVLFDNADALSTAIYSEAALQDGIDRSIGELFAIRKEARAALATVGPSDRAVATAIHRWIAILNEINSTVLEAVQNEPSSLSRISADIVLHLRDAEKLNLPLAEPKFSILQDRLRHVASGPDSIVSKRRQLLQAQREIDDLLEKNEFTSVKLSDAVKGLAESVRLDVTEQNQALSELLGGRLRLMLMLGALGLTGAITIGAFTQISVIGRLNRLRGAMTGSFSLEAAQILTRGSDEIAEMSRAVMNYVDEISRRDEDVRHSRQRLTEAIESLPGGFSLYDADDRLVVCNARYRHQLYPGMEDTVEPGQSFEAIVRKAVEYGLIRVPDGDVGAWIAERITQHRNPSGVTVHQRKDGAWIEVRERRAANGDTVAIYTDVTKRKHYEAELVKARQAAEKSKELADERSRALERLSGQLSKYLSPQVYASIFTSRRDVVISSTRKKLTIFFADIANFAETTDSIQSEELTALLNHYLTEMSEIALKHGATIDKYIGDAIMAFFGDPESHGVKEDAVACVEMAIAMQRRMRVLAEDWRSSGVERPFQMRIGINTGFCTVGNFGSENRMDYTIIGSEVNLAARLQGYAELGGILLAHETYALVCDRFASEEQDPITVKGFAKPIRVHRILGIDEAAEGAERVLLAQFEGADIRVDISRLSDLDRARLKEVAKALISRLER